MINNDDMNDEYKMQEEENQNLALGEEYSEYPEEHLPEEPVPQPAKIAKFKKLLIPIGIIIAIFIVYNILNWFSAKKSQVEVRQEAEIAQKQQQAAIATAKEQQEATAQQTPVTATQQLQRPPMQQNLNQDQLNEINKNNEAIKEQLTTLNQKLAANQAEILNLSNKMDTLAGAVITIQDEIQKAKEEALQQKKLKTAKPKTVKLPIYHVRAIVPNRAWLETAEGKTVTVRVGNKLDGYGTVELISPKQGMVVMSSGTIIQYGINDF